MLFVLTGASCSGKTQIAERCRAIENLAVFDFDEHGVPDVAGTEWRQRTLDGWIRVAIDQQELGNDTLLAGPNPLGEVLASPLATRLDGIAVLLVDVDDYERIARMERRSPTALYLDGGRGILGWADWHRRHARDPRHAQHWITTNAWDEMKWNRWTRLPPRSWHVDTIDTTELPLDDAVAQVTEWIARERVAVPPVDA